MPLAKLLRVNLFTVFSTEKQENHLLKDAFITINLANVKKGRYLFCKHSFFTTKRILKKINFFIRFFKLLYKT